MAAMGAGPTDHRASVAATRDALDRVGFAKLAVDDRRPWRLDQPRGDIERLAAGATRDRMHAAFGDHGLDAWRDLWRRIAALVAGGELRPVHLRATRPRDKPA